jgi:hypothetical protein
VRRSVPSNPLRWFGDSPTTLTHPDDTASWERVAEAVGEPDPFVCKAAYVCGVVRQEVESAALLDAVRRHTASAQVLLGGVEVLGRGLCPPPHNSPGHRPGGSHPPGRRRPRSRCRAANGQQPRTKRPTATRLRPRDGAKRTRTRPSDYETDARRRSGRLQTDLASSRWIPRRSRRL